MICTISFYCIPITLTLSVHSSESTPISALDDSWFPVSINIMPWCKSCASCITVTVFRKINCGRKNVNTVKSFDDNHSFEHPIVPNKKRRTTVIDVLPSVEYGGRTMPGSSHDHSTPYLGNDSQAKAAQPLQFTGIASTTKYIIGCQAWRTQYDTKKERIAQSQSQGQGWLWRGWKYVSSIFIQWSEGKQLRSKLSSQWLKIVMSAMWYWRFSHTLSTKQKWYLRSFAKSLLVLAFMYTITWLVWLGRGRKNVHRLFIYAFVPVFNIFARILIFGLTCITLTLISGSLRKFQSQHLTNCVVKQVTSSWCQCLEQNK